MTLQPLLPDRAYKVTVSAIHYTGESEITSTTGRTGRCISQNGHGPHNLPSIGVEAISIGAAMSCLHWAMAKAVILLSRVDARVTLKRDNPALISALL